MQKGIVCAIVSAMFVFGGCSGGGGQGKGFSGGNQRGSSNRPPTIAGSPPPTIPPDETYDFTPKAADPDGDPLSFTILRKPDWATFDTVTGRLAGTPAESHLGPYTSIVISVTDGIEMVALEVFDIVVSQTGEGAATLSWTPPTENVDGSAITNLAGYRIYYGRNPKSMNQKVVLHNPGLTRYLVEYLPRGKWHFAMTAVNSAGMESKRSRRVHKRVG